MKKILKNREAVSPVLAVLLLIAIAVGAAVVTYAWVMGFVGTQTQQSGAVLVVDRVAWNGTTLDASHEANATITIRNTGTGPATIVAIYWGTNTPGNYSQAITTIKWDSVGTSHSWKTTTCTIQPGGAVDICTDNLAGVNATGVTVYFKIVTKAGMSVTTQATT